MTVPDEGGGTGFIDVMAQVDANESQTAVGLFDVTGGGNTFVPGQDTTCTQSLSVSLPGDLFMTPDNFGIGISGTYGTPMTAGFSCSPAGGGPAPVLIEVTAGTRTFQLEYADCGCGGTPTVENRRLWITPHPMS